MKIKYIRTIQRRLPWRVSEPWGAWKGESPVALIDTCPTCAGNGVTRQLSQTPPGRWAPLVSHFSLQDIYNFFSHCALDQFEKIKFQKKKRLLCLKKPRILPGQYVVVKKFLNCTEEVLASEISNSHPPAWVKKKFPNNV